MEAGKTKERDEALLTGINLGTKAGKKRAILVLYGRKAGNVSMLCKAVNISRKTFYRWLEEDLKFREEVDAEQESLIDYSESKLYEAIGKGGKEGIVATIFHLKTKGKKRGYVETREYTGKDGEALFPNGVRAADVLEELRRILTDLKLSESARNELFQVLELGKVVA